LITFIEYRDWKDQSKPPPQQQYQRGCQENSQEVNTTNHHHKTPTPPQNTQSISTTKPHLVFLFFSLKWFFFVVLQGKFPWQPLIPIIILYIINKVIKTFVIFFFGWLEHALWWEDFPRPQFLARLHYFKILLWF